jgi:hypothetical protein
MTIVDYRNTLERHGVTAVSDTPESSTRFADGARYRVEIASVEGPNVLRAVIEEAAVRGVRVQRVSQGSGVMMLTDAEILEMVELGHEHGIEIGLFLGSRADWEVGGMSLASELGGASARGAKGLLAAFAETRRACDLGIRSVLVTDVGVLALLSELREAGDLPADLRFKTSVMLPCANPATARAFERLGANTLNIPTDLSVSQIAELRAATTLPLDVYLESPDDLGGFVRPYDVVDLIRAAAPVYVKLGLRNATSVYPSGGHIESVAIAQAVEKVRRAELALRLLRELDPDLYESGGELRPADLAVPVPARRPA